MSTKSQILIRTFIIFLVCAFWTIGIQVPLYLISGKTFPEVIGTFRWILFLLLFDMAGLVLWLVHFPFKVSIRWMILFSSIASVSCLTAFLLKAPKNQEVYIGYILQDQGGTLGLVTFGLSVMLVACLTDWLCRNNRFGWVYFLSLSMVVNFLTNILQIYFNTVGTIYGAYQMFLIIILASSAYIALFSDLIELLIWEFSSTIRIERITGYVKKTN